MIKEWFWNKEFSNQEKYAIQSGVNSLNIIKETDKAKCFQWKTDFGIITKWIPKSCIVEIN